MFALGFKREEYQKTEQMLPVCLRKRTSEVNSPAAPVATAAAQCSDQATVRQDRVVCWLSPTGSRSAQLASTHESSRGQAQASYTRSAEASKRCITRATALALICRSLFSSRDLGLVPLGYRFLCMRQMPWPKGSLQKAVDPCLAFSNTCSFLAPESSARARAASRSST